LREAWVSVASKGCKLHEVLQAIRKESAFARVDIEILLEHLFAEIEGPTHGLAENSAVARTGRRPGKRNQQPEALR